MDKKVLHLLILEQEIIANKIWNIDENNITEVISTNDETYLRIKKDDFNKIKFNLIQYHQTLVENSFVLISSTKEKNKRKLKFIIF